MTFELEVTTSGEQGEEKPLVCAGVSLLVAGLSRTHHLTRFKWRLSPVPFACIRHNGPRQADRNECGGGRGPFGSVCRGTLGIIGFVWHWFLQGCLFAICLQQ